MTFENELMPLKNLNTGKFDSISNNPIKIIKIVVFWFLTVIIPFFVPIAVILITGQSFDGAIFDDPFIYLLTIVLGEVSIIILGMIFLTFEKQSFIRDTGLQWEKRRSVKYFVIGLIVGTVIIISRDTISVVLQVQEISGQDLTNVSFILFSFISATLIALFSSIAEETAYRGIIQKNLSFKLPNYLAIGITSILFVFPHALGGLDALELLTIFMNSVLFGLFFLFTNKLYIPIGLHFGNNFMIIFLDSCLAYQNVNVPALALVQSIILISLLVYVVLKRNSLKLKS